MAHFTFSFEAPHATAYDPDYPTRSTENYSHAMHELLEELENTGDSWYIQNDLPKANYMDTFAGYYHDAIEAVYDYAEGAIDTYRSSGTPTLTKPTAISPITKPSTAYYPSLIEKGFAVYTECLKVCYFIYYMWKTEEDPLLFKEKLRELLLAWPLTDLTVELNTEAGQEMKIYPSWKNVDL